MNWALIFFFTTLLCICVIAYLATRFCRVREQLSIIKDVLEDIKKGNLNRRILTRKNDMTKTICYNINEIAASDQAQLIRQKQSEQAYKRLMTSLSHDVKTPLTSLVGYLEAIQEKIVTGEEKEEYIRVALDKANHLKGFVESLFEWVKLDAKEQIFQFETCDLNELSRDVLADWIPTLEDKQFAYEIDIPDAEYSIRLDRNAYTRILNNLLQNVLLHSEGNEVSIHISEDEKQANIIVADNGKGIPEKDLSHIFERLYQGDESRGGIGNGLGLSIVQELVAVHDGTICAESLPHGGTTLTISLPKAL
ncbi:Histidine kinase [Tepidanaerobacter acetatoxydans Re1]|uniref:histidine kinase n=1 Tax=Tepidanaerobacter acetatoxydans (strain DSM 21804 / JCM 16047 / Re1) TaxID=1209989 RepID=F4LRP4_TEPAE|nr:HAMP domain-containing sensor histidine kinase [Tepidanaerobacter acetatoxydans]AEE91112.1 histidine kinase [Tepidanaerobacter acetatoxydans Re1]CDI40559.1 Histidine kinase [Tepidanaerobacter acetatoxydans Re1]